MSRAFGRLTSALILTTLLLVAVVSNGVISAKVTIEYWFGESPQAYIAAMTDLVTNFEALNPDIKVDMILKGHCSNAVYMEALQIAIAGGAPPDAAYMDGADAFTWSLRGLVQPLNRLWSPQTLAGIEAGALPGPKMEMTRNGLWYGVPFRCSTSGLYMNVDVFGAAGFDAKKGPTVLTQLDSMALKLTRTKGDGSHEVVGFVPNGNNWGDGLCWLWAFGGEYFDYQTNELTLTGVPSHLKALEWILSYAERYGGTTKGSAAGFASGKFAMFIHSTSGLTQFGELNPNLNWWTGAVPTAEGVGPVALGFSLGPAIPVGARHPEEAARFLAYLGGPEAQTSWFQKTHSPPTRMESVRAIARMIDDPREWNLVEQLPTTRVIAPLFMQLRQIWRPTLDRMRIKEITPAEVLESVQRQMGPVYRETFAGAR